MKKIQIRSSLSASIRTCELVPDQVGSSDREVLEGDDERVSEDVSRWLGKTP